MPKENKSISVSVRMTEKDYSIVKKKAKEQGISISAVIVNAAVEKKTVDPLMTQKTVACLKAISSGCRGLRDDYERCRSCYAEKDLREAINRISLIEKEMGELWQSLR